MVKKPFRGNYLELKVRVSYDKKTDSIHLTSKDKDLGATRGFHLALNGGRDAEYILRELLEREGLIPKDRSKIIPECAFLGDSSYNRTWNTFPLGVFADGEEAIWDPTRSPHMLIAGSAGSGKSVIQRNLIFHVVQNPNEWMFVGIDLSRVELTPYKKYEPAVLGVATSIEEAWDAIDFAHEQMMARYQLMVDSGVNNFRDLEEIPRALMLMVDNISVLLAKTGSKDPQLKKEDALKDEMANKLTDIARLGRAAGIHLVIATQRPDVIIIGGEFKQNLTTRIAAGRMDSQGSYMALGNDQATKLNGAIKGRGYFQEYGEGADFQGYFAPQDWIDTIMRENP